MQSASTFAVLALVMLASPALAFDVQNGGGDPALGSANLASEASVPGVSLDMDLRAQLGLPEEKTKNSLSTKSGLQFGAGVFSGAAAANPTALGYDESPWIAPRRPPGRD